MSDKKDKGYDPTMMRFVGNILAGSEAFQNYSSATYRQSIEQAAIDSAIRVRDALKKLAKKEESNG